MQVNQEDRITPQETSSGSNRFALFAIVLVILLSIAGYYYYIKDNSGPKLIPNAPIVLPDSPATEPMMLEGSPEEPAQSDGEAQEPKTETLNPQDMPEPVTIVETVPSLPESDDFVHQKALAIINNTQVGSALVTQDLARQFVVFVDNLAQGDLTRKVSPVKGPETLFSVSEITNKVYLNPESYHRYDAYASVLASMDSQTLLATYKQLTPLFDEAFAELGYTDAKFNDRILQAIKLMLAAPIIEEPIELTSISVNYRFVDPNLEALPSAQKLMIRMGPENTRKVKAALRKLENQLAQ
ncbi:DUF3014 domain-containing protein [Shewanella sp. A25]|nr:DUF3014 domain-containing protein [Shewanella shenzhenensis]